MNYLVIVEKGTTSYGAYIPDLPGCVAVGETHEEVMRQVQEAIEFHLEGLKEDGIPVLPPAFSSFDCPALGRYTVSSINS